jgi:branched-chain amino acid transport system ATP-binding protein
MTYLEVDRINSFYGDSHILFDVTVRVEKSDVVALLGRNGAGKSTTLKTISGLVVAQSGAIRLEGIDLRGARPHVVAQHGIQLVPEERRIFGSLTVEENLALGALTAKPAWPLARIYEMFPRLRDRRASRGAELSGGEQQMLAIARALIRMPKILLLDEPFEGLAPKIVHDLLAVCERLAEAGQTIVIVEQNIAAALSIAKRAYILNNGHIVFDGTADELKTTPAILSRHLGV